MLTFKMGNGWITLSGHTVGTATTKARSRAVATLRRRLRKLVIEAEVG